MSKIIIENRAPISDTKALRLVIGVLKQGKISNNGKQHCYINLFKTAGESGKGVVVASVLNKNSERFVIYEEVNRKII